MNKINILTVCNDKYFNYYQSLINSIEINSKESINTFYSYFVNVDEDKVHSFIDTKPNIIANFSKVSVDSTDNKYTRYDCGLLNGRFMSQEFAYLNNLRYSIIPKYIKEQRESNTNIGLLYLDVDNLVIKNLSELVNYIYSHDISIYKYPITDHPIQWRKFTTYACGLIGINPTENSYHFFNELQNEIFRNDVNTVGDQLDFFNVYNRLYQHVNLCKLPITCKDDRFHENSLIWSGDGNRKNNPTWINKQLEFIC